LLSLLRSLYYLLSACGMTGNPLFVESLGEVFLLIFLFLLSLYIGLGVSLLDILLELSLFYT
jgi:hypothetical protein